MKLKDKIINLDNCAVQYLIKPYRKGIIIGYYLVPNMDDVWVDTTTDIISCRLQDIIAEKVYQNTITSKIVIKRKLRI